MICPECGISRVGNRRGKCGTCNRFAARTRTALLALLRRNHPALHSRLTKKAEAEEYAKLSQNRSTSGR